MTIRYVDGIDGSDANDGLAAYLGGGHGPKLTLNGCENTPVVAGDFCWVRPTVYREMLTCDVSGANAYSTGTVTLTNGSAVVTGSGTSWLANVAAQYEFIVSIIASGTDGVANGTSTFTSAAGKFEASMVGKIIQINTKGSWKIGAVGAANSITLVDVNYGGATWPAAGVGLSYSVMSGEGPVTIASVDLDTQLTLVGAWNGPTLTLGTAYLTYNPITYCGDVAGEIWGVGGVVRVTGSDNDQTATRASCVTCAAQRNYRTFRGFMFDTTTTYTITGGATAGTNWIIEDCIFQSYSNSGIYIAGANQLAWTIRRCVIYGTGGNGWVNINMINAQAVDNSGHLIENCNLLGPSCLNGRSILINGVGGVIIRNCIAQYFNIGLLVLNISAGQTVTVNNCVISNGYSFGLSAGVLGQIIENYNMLYIASRNNVAVGANSNTYPPLFDLGILHSGAGQISGFRFPPPLFGSLSQWSQVRAIADTGAATEDILGLPRPVTAGKRSWGAVQWTPVVRETGTVPAGKTVSIELSDAGRVQIRFPVSNVATTVTVQCYREANYAGVNPQMVLKQAGQAADRTTTDAGAAGAWNTLTDTFTPAATPGWMTLELVSGNTAAAGNYKAYFGAITLSVSPALGDCATWLWDTEMADWVAAAAAGGLLRHPGMQGNVNG